MRTHFLRTLALHDPLCSPEGFGLSRLWGSPGFGALRSISPILVRIRGHPSGPFSSYGIIWGRLPISGVSSPTSFPAFEPVPPAVASNHCVKEPKSTSALLSIWGSLAVFVKVQRLTDSDYYTASALPLRSLVGLGTYPNRSSRIKRLIHFPPT
jgi:hypothetical protein